VTRCFCSTVGLLGGWQRILILKGSRLLGRYEADVSTGQTRILVAWDRVTLPDHRSIELAANGADALGRAGLSGDVDAHL